MDANYTPAYKTYYVRGIHQLYELDCGNLSGWTYQVNGIVPNYGCSKYTVKAGDVIALHLYLFKVEFFQPFFPFRGQAEIHLPFVCLS